MFVVTLMLFIFNNVTPLFYGEHMFQNETIFSPPPDKR